jgi:N4-gp56 family major capsid protein
MSNSSFHADLKVQQWQKKFYVEYIRGQRFARYTGTDENKVFQLVKDLSKKRGESITIQLVTRLTGSGVTGDNTLRGNEEAISNYGDTITVDQLRNATSVGHMEQQKGNIDFLNAGRMLLKLWAMEKLRDDMITAMESPNLDGKTSYASSSATQRNAWDTANGDRILYGDAKSNRTAGNVATSLDKLDATTDVLDPDMVSTAKRMARDADPHIRPVRVAEDEEWFVLFCNKWAFRDFKNSSDYLSNLRNAGPRSLKDNPLFRDGDLVHDGVILREIPEMGVMSNVGATGTVDGAANYLCGAQALGVAWAETTSAISDEDDYGNIKGVGIKEIRGVQKLFFNDKQHGMLTLYTAAVADS